jgi:hypothetical protein
MSAAAAAAAAATAAAVVVAPMAVFLTTERYFEWDEDLQCNRLRTRMVESRPQHMKQVRPTADGRMRLRVVDVDGTAITLPDARATRPGED